MTITINGHSWRSGLDIVRGRNLIGVSSADRRGAGAATGDEVEVQLDLGPRVVVEPAEFAHALDADPTARAAYDRLTHSRRREYVRAIENAMESGPRPRRIGAAVEDLRGSGPAEG